MRLVGLATLSIEKDVSNKLDMKEIVEEFAALKVEDDNVEVVEVQMEDDNVEVVEFQMDDVIVVDVLPADARAELEFADIFDHLPPDVDEEFEPIPLGVPVAAERLPMRDRPAGVQHPLPDQHNIGALDAVCRECNARHFHCERAARGHFSTCCNNGQVTATGQRVLLTATVRLTNLLIDDSQDGTNFRRETRRYNNSLAFAAFSSDLNRRRLPGRGPSVYTVHGQVYRRVNNDVVGNEHRPPSYCELYFVNSAEANQSGMRQTGCRRPSFGRNMSRLWLEEQERANANPDLIGPRSVSMHFVTDAARDQRPTANKVAAVFVGDDGRPPRELNLVIFDRNPVDPRHRMQTIPAGSCHADPMLYPLFFPHGESGWHFNVMQEGNRNNQETTILITEA
ncbi:LOW QUALITY PROTEIN: uncharacterized protein LOC132926182 [Rhopalosiphum padi]|uniref:LOW QUALITY PROTEIN: uncharacterized protein LOC132926182 n=1 Tax=Rhopalosiphum padi TaxID=40932 RepID=UPI00298DB61E|nr:LOW QUALITY PROTEIN: uncharacterized protein LOC132926182 [Rhopalosiphum padi]